MDFEEFLWANAFSSDQIARLKEYFLKRKEVPEPLHSILKEKYLNYLCVGGFPKAVHSYVKNHNIMDAEKEKTGNRFLRHLKYPEFRMLLILFQCFLQRRTRGTSHQKLQVVLQETNQMPSSIWYKRI